MRDNLLLREVDAALAAMTPETEDDATLIRSVQQKMHMVQFWAAICERDV